MQKTWNERWQVISKRGSFPVREDWNEHIATDSCIRQAFNIIRQKGTTWRGFKDKPVDYSQIIALIKKQTWVNVCGNGVGRWFTYVAVLSLGRQKAGIDWGKIEVGLEPKETTTHNQPKGKGPWSGYNNKSLELNGYAPLVWTYINSRTPIMRM